MESVPKLPKIQLLRVAQKGIAVLCKSQAMNHWEMGKKFVRLVQVVRPFTSYSRMEKTAMALPSSTHSHTQ